MLLGDMIQAWLNGDDDVTTRSGPPSWSSLATALERTGHTAIASKVRKGEQSKSMRLQTLICFYFIEKLGQVLTTPSLPRPTPAGEQFNTECVISYWYMVLLMNAGPSVNPLPDEVDSIL